MCIYHGIYDEIFHQAEAAAEAVRAMGKEAGAKGWKSWGVSMWDPWELVGLFHFSDLFKLKVVVLPVTQMASDLQWLIGTGNLLPWRWLVAMEVMSYPQKRYKNKATNPRVLRRRSPVIIAMVIKYYNLVVMITHISKRYVINISAMEKTCFFLRSSTSSRLRRQVWWCGPWSVSIASDGRVGLGWFFLAILAMVWPWKHQGLYKLDIYI